VNAGKKFKNDRKITFTDKAHDDHRHVLLNLPQATNHNKRSHFTHNG
jgi:hypothetical protein